MSEDSKDNEIKKLKSELDKVIKENVNLRKFNDDLRDQVKLLTAKLSLFQQLNSSLNTSQSKSSNHPNQSTKTKIDDHNDLIQESISKKMKITDLVTNICQENVSLNDYVYDQKSKTYLSKSTGWYFYEERNLFYDPKSENYYSYNRENNTFAFHTTLKDVLKNKRKEEKKKLQLDKSKLEDGEISDGEILDSDDESSDSDCQEVAIDNRLKEDMSTEYIAPCVRLIVKQADNLDLGSLLIITVTGAVLGKQNTCDLEFDEDLISDQHAKFVFNHDDNCYYIEDLDSFGTFLNNQQIEPNVQTKIKHNDILRLGDNLEFLVHIHDKYNSCIHCEPGEVQHKLKSSVASSSNQLNEFGLSKEDKEKARKKELKTIMKKFGINPYKKQIAVDTDNYKDRALERRKVKGSSSDAHKMEQASLDKPIEENNKGFKLLEKMGWKKDDDKDTKLIETKFKDNRRGLGF